MIQQLSTARSHFTAWLLQKKHRALARLWTRRTREAFVDHPEETGETYWQHLAFTVVMSARFILVSTVLMIHGLFPFLCTRTASKQIERIYSIMKSRIPKARRDAIDVDFSI